MTHRTIGAAYTAAWAARKKLEDPTAWAEKRHDEVLRWRRRNPEKNAAHCKVYKAVRSGALVKPDACERCGDTSKRLEGSHDDYSRPLDVEWLCRPCHAAKDAKPR